jgi:hypothetical protein
VLGFVVMWIRIAVHVFFPLVDGITWWMIGCVVTLLRLNVWAWWLTVWAVLLIAWR